MVGFISCVETMTCLEEDVVALVATNRRLREEAITLLLEIAALRERMKAGTDSIGAPRLPVER